MSVSSSSSSSSDGTNSSLTIEFMNIERSNELLKSLDKDRKSEHFTDFTIIAGKRKFPAHRIVLASFSSVLEKLIQFGGQETQKSLATLHYVDPDSFAAIMDYAYTGCITLSPETVQLILVIADYLQVTYVAKECQSFIESNMNYKNICPILQFAYNYSLSRLKRSAAYYFAFHLDNIHNYDKKSYAELDVSILIEIFSADNLVIHLPKLDSESDIREELVLTAVLHYISCSTLTDSPTIGKLLNTVRLPKIQEGRAKVMIDKFESIKDLGVVKDFIALDEKVRKNKNSPPTDSEQIPSSWYKARKLTNYSIVSSVYRYGCKTDWQSFRSSQYQTIDPEVSIQSISIWIRPALEDHPEIIGGIGVRYISNAVTGCTLHEKLNYARGSFLPDWQHCLVDLNRGEYIIEVTIWATNYRPPDGAIHGIHFYTSDNRLLGPFGQIIGRNYIEHAPFSPIGSCLYSIDCDTILRDGHYVIASLSVRWIAF